jgi:hypothetical protein
MNHFHNQTTIEGSAPTFWRPQQTMANMFRQGSAHTAHSFSMPNPGSAPYTLGYNGRADTNPNGNYQASYTTVAYTNPIPMLDSSVGFLMNSTYHNAMRHKMLGQPEFDGFGYETPLQFAFRLQSIDITPARATAKLGTDPNNLTNQLATILRESVIIEPKG